MIHHYNKVKLGLFGGSFNPPHFGHLSVSKIATKSFKLYRIFWVVVPQNPFKKNLDMLPLAKRIGLANSLIGRSRHEKAIDFESDLRSFETVNTIKKAKLRMFYAKIFWIMGLDNFFHFHKWKRYEYIMQNVEILAFPRGNFHKAVRTRIFTRYKKKIHFLKGKNMAISSTEIRQKFGSFWRDLF